MAAPKKYPDELRDKRATRLGLDTRRDPQNSSEAIAPIEAPRRCWRPDRLASQIVESGQELRARLVAEETGSHVESRFAPFERVAHTVGGCAWE